jgi:hypothetical protein
MMVIRWAANSTMNVLLAGQGPFGRMVVEGAGWPRLFREDGGPGGRLAKGLQGGWWSRGRLAKGLQGGWWSRGRLAKGL